MSVSDLRYPDGLIEDHARPRPVIGRLAELVPLLVLGTLLLIALTGSLGGSRTSPRIADAPAARLSVNVPATLRNGEFFEMRFEITAKAPIADATIAVPPSLWKDMTINTTVPGASEEEYRDGAFRFRYGPLKAGERLAIKVDGQINPPLTLGTSGDVMLYDGDRPLATVPVAIRVLP